MNTVLIQTSFLACPCLNSFCHAGFSMPPSVSKQHGELKLIYCIKMIFNMQFQSPHGFFMIFKQMLSITISAIY